MQKFQRVFQWYSVFSVVFIFCFYFCVLCAAKEHSFIDILKGVSMLGIHARGKGKSVWCSVLRCTLSTQCKNVYCVYIFSVFLVFLKPFTLQTKHQKIKAQNCLHFVGFSNCFFLLFVYKKNCTKYYLVRSNNSFHEFYCIAHSILFWGLLIVIIMNLN